MRCMRHPQSLKGLACERPCNPACNVCEHTRSMQPEILNMVGRMAKAGFPDHDAASYLPDPAGGRDRLDCSLAASYLYYM